MGVFKQYKDQQGFTIVELLIVIVIIGILAALVIIGYNGITQRAKNTQSINAATAWLKIMTNYKTTYGAWPSPTGVCLGSDYKWNENESSSGVAQCRDDGGAIQLKENTTFNNAVSQFTNNNLPSPAFVTASTGGSPAWWKRGISYFQGGGGVLRIDVAMAGQGSCPSMSGITGAQSNYANSNSVCMYTIGNISDTN